MKKIIRRMLLLMLTAVIAVGAHLTAIAAPETPEKNVESAVMVTPARSESADGSMETALVAAKRLIDIDDDIYTDFNYSSSFSNYETREGLLWTFYWSGSDNANINATLTADGVLLNFSKYNWSEDGFGFAKTSKSEAIVIANGFIKKANPGTYSFYKAPETVFVDIRSNNYSLNYYAEINGYYFQASQINVNVNKFTGEITGYSTNRISPDKYKFEDAAGIIDESAAVSAYADKIGLNLEYRSYYDYENKSFKVFPVYLFNSRGDRFIGAKSGDIVTYVYDRGLESDGYAKAEMDEREMSTADSAGGRAKQANLTPAEISAIEQAAKFISSEQALRKLLEAAELTNLNVASFSEQYIGLNRDHIDNSRYFYDVSLYKYNEYELSEDEIVSIYGRVDAVTGRVMSFSFRYNGYPEGQKSMTKEQAEAAVTAFLKKMAPGEVAKAKLEDIGLPEVTPYSYRTGSYYFNYVRYENDVPYRDNGINVTINEKTGKVTSYSLNWHENIKFPSVANVISKQRALDGFVNQNGSKIRYITTGEGNAALVYDFSGKDYIDPLTGKALDYTGEPWVDNSVEADYSDVSGHWSELFVTKLRDNGIVMWSGKFEPEKVMTELEFLQYLMLADQQYYPYVTRLDTVAYFNQRGVKVEASPDKLLTRQEAVRIIVEYLGYGKLAGQSKWFVYPFSDDVGESYKGYITICYMLGIVTGNGSAFNAASNVTRAQAAVMLHNIIISKS